MTDDHDVRTWTPGELHEVFSGLLDHVFGSVVWVEGELVDRSRSPADHVYFRLVDADGGRPEARPSLSVVLFDTERRAVNQFLRTHGDPIRMSDGVRIRIGGRLRTYAARSTLQLVMDRIDPAFTLGLIGQERLRVLAALRAEGLLGANAQVPMPPVPLRVALVTSVRSAAHADALDELRRSGIGFHVSVLDARTQGADAAASVCAALRTAGGLGVDVVLLVRGGGASTDLVAFDAESVARAIAASPVPVLTGIGHEVDTTVADAVAHAAYKTPTAAAVAIVETTRRAERRVADAANALRGGVDDGLLRAHDRLARLGHRAGTVAVHRLDRHQDALDRHARDVAASSRRGLRGATATVDALTQRVRPTAARVSERAEDRLTVLAARARAHDPQAALRRGWTLTRSADGRAVRSVRDVVVGDELTTTTADGVIRSRVTDDERGPAT